MNTTFHTLNLFFSLSFVGFGLACLSTEQMRVEFTRYGLARFRTLTGYLQLAGATGLFLGWWSPFIGLAAALGLSLQMLAGVGVRIHIRDRWSQCLPAALYCVGNAALVWLYLARL